jgi:hypothetical protein
MINEKAQAVVDVGIDDTRIAWITYPFSERDQNGMFIHRDHCPQDGLETNDGEYDRVIPSWPGIQV